MMKSAMRKVALVFVLAVIVPSLVLAWLAVRSLRDQQFLIERQQSLLSQRVTDTLAQSIADRLSQQQHDFSSQVEKLAAGRDARTYGSQFDSLIRDNWPLAEVGFCVTLSGQILSPAASSRSDARQFYLDNSAFLGNREVAEVYWNANAADGANNVASNNGYNNNSSGGGNGWLGSFGSRSSSSPNNSSFYRNANSETAQFAQDKQELTPTGQVSGSVLDAQQSLATAAPQQQKDAAIQSPLQNNLNFKAAEARKVSPQSQGYQRSGKSKASKMLAEDTDNNLSRVVPAEAEFAQLIGGQTDGMLARFLQNKLKLMYWHRLGAQPDLVFGAQVNLSRVVSDLRELVQTDPDLGNEICLVLLDDNAHPVLLSQPGFQANWKRPFVATEIGDALPHWEIAAYLVDPTAFTRTACIVNIIFGLLIAVLVLAIVIGSWLIVRSLNHELTLARQKTDFVSNVSHELKTPLTSIRMFSELLADGRVADPDKQRSYLNIITAEAARLTRLINNVLDFSRMERGEKKYNFQPCDLAEVLRTTAQTFRPHFEAAGFKFGCEPPDSPVPIHGDADALSQVLVNLLSNAEKYGANGGAKEINLQLTRKQSPLPHVEICVLDRGPGVPRGSEEKIFEKFYRAHDSLGSGIQGSGLGLTIARQIARAHGGDVVYEPREGGGSCFILRLPVKVD